MLPPAQLALSNKWIANHLHSFLQPLLQSCTNFAVLGVPGKVGQLAGIVLQIVEFIQSVGVIVTHQLPSVVRAQQAHVRPEWVFSGWAFQRFFITPDFQRKVSLRGFQLVDHRPSPMPSAFFIESRGSLVSDRACQPSSYRRRFQKAEPLHRPSTRLRRPNLVIVPRRRVDRVRCP